MSGAFFPEFAGRVAVVTGGSEGLGFGFCRALTDAGCRVYFCALEPERGAAAARLLGPDARFFPADLADPEQIRRFAGFVAERESAVDYLVNNAAVDDRNRVDETSAEFCDRLWQVNLRAVLLMTQAFLDPMRRGQGKAILNLGTTNSMIGLAPFTAYAATKHGIWGYTRALARELGPEGIRANLLSPGWIMTEKQLALHVTEADKAELLRAQSLPFLLTEDHVTPAALFLLSDGAGAITGQNLVVDGGKYMA